MVMRVQVVEGEYRVVLPPEAVEKLRIKDGSTVDVVTVDEMVRSKSKYVGIEEGMKAYFETLPDHRESYRELAK